MTQRANLTSLTPAVSIKLGPDDDCPHRAPASRPPPDILLAVRAPQPTAHWTGGGTPSFFSCGLCTRDLRRIAGHLPYLIRGCTYTQLYSI